MGASKNESGTRLPSETHTDATGGMDGKAESEETVTQHFALLYRFALSLTRTEDEARDLVQQTYYLWAKKGHQLVDRSKLKSWLLTTLHREFLARLRHRTRFPHYELSEVEPELPEVPPEIPVHLDWQIVMECLAEVDRTFQAPVSLFYLEDYSYNEIGEILEIPIGTVKSRISRGIAQLQRLLTKRFSSLSAAKRTQ